MSDSKLQHYADIGCRRGEGKLKGPKGTGYYLDCPNNRGLTSKLSPSPVAIIICLFVFLCMVVSGAVLIGKNPIETLESKENSAKLRSTGIALVTIGSVLFTAGLIVFFLYDSSSLRSVGVYTHNRMGRELDSPIFSETRY